MNTTIKALVFDVYGTLFDVYSVETKCDEIFGQKGKEVSILWRRKQLEYSFLRQLMGQYQPFKQVTEDALIYALQYYNLDYDDSQLQELMDAYTTLKYYPEVTNVLEKMKDKQLAVFSNGSRDMLEPLIEKSGLLNYFDAIISVDDIKQYKPTPASYTHVLNVLGVERKEVLFMSSNGWDISGAKNFGFQTAWINRGQAPTEVLNLVPHGEYDDLRGILEWEE
ncbi:haloacid dehalogenase type II [Gracilibacillus caseinilyticus]|uniref:Haloacid dehalogenase type II n=1 Tax=Gracilibacillus caseinilyticus TaxID=2932256 RepID=A0ABY4EQR4_9BACI|nr:haloacid dehalogenase type II [Gracilibacillus caseinilyticus]UOQ46791.1 haloacid dehalogenase type II [Gracilibacillus caseinilyticus]